MYKGSFIIIFSADFCIFFYFKIYKLWFSASIDQISVEKSYLWNIIIAIERISKANALRRGIVLAILKR